MLRQFQVSREEITMDTLEQLLSQPLKTIVDNGFSQRIIERINQYQTLRTKVFSVLTVTLSLIFLWAFPVKNWLTGLFTTTQDLGNSFAQKIMPSEIISQVKLLLNANDIFQQPSALISISFITLFTVMFISSYLTD